MCVFGPCGEMSHFYYVDCYTPAHLVSFVLPAAHSSPIQILFWKKRAEEALQRSGLHHTIVRPGGLKSRLGPGESTAGNIVMGRAGTYGFPPLQKSGSILRSQVRAGWTVLLQLSEGCWLTV